MAKLNEKNQLAANIVNAAAIRDGSGWRDRAAATGKNERGVFDRKTYVVQSFVEEQQRPGGADNQQRLPRKQRENDAGHGRGDQCFRYADEVFRFIR